MTWSHVGTLWVLVGLFLLIRKLRKNPWISKWLGRLRDLWIGLVVVMALSATLWITLPQEYRAVPKTVFNGCISLQTTVGNALGFFSPQCVESKNKTWINKCGKNVGSLMKKVATEAQAESK